LIDRLLPRRDLTIAWGEPKCGKTFWALDIAFHIAMGRPYRGHKVEQGSVVYCAFEGQHGIRDRVAAFHSYYNTKADNEVIPLWFMLSRLTFTKPGAITTRRHMELISAILDEGIKPSLIVLDTLNRSLDGSESSDEDMTFYTKCAEQIADTFSSAVLIIHHCGIAKDRPRGHTSLTGTAACQIAIRRENYTDGEKRMVSHQVEYIKDGPEGIRECSWLVPIKVGVDQFGTDITSCVIEPGLSPSAGNGSSHPFLGSQSQKALTILTGLVARSDVGWVSIASWRESCIRGNIAASKNMENKRRAFLRAYDNLSQADKIEVEQDQVRLRL